MQLSEKVISINPKLYAQMDLQDHPRIIFIFKEYITMKNNKLNCYQTEYINCNTLDKSFEVHLLKNIPDDKVNKCISNVNSMLKILPAETLVIDSSNLLIYDLELNWKIFESSWDIFYKNGGERIVFLYKSGLPAYLIDEYRRAINEYGIPINIEFKSVKTLHDDSI